MKDHIDIVGTAVLWAALAVWRETAEARFGDVEREALRHFASLAAESSEPLHPVRLGDRILVPRSKEDPREYAETYVGVDGRIERTWLTIGELLGQLPGLVFHGIFALTIVGLVARR